jgi:hypothetical protein
MAAYDYDFELDLIVEDARATSGLIQRAESLELFNTMVQVPGVLPLALAADVFKAYNKDPGEYIDPELARLIQAYMLQQQQGKG